MIKIELTVRERNLLLVGFVLVFFAGSYWGVNKVLEWFDSVQIEKNKIINAQNQIEAYGREYNLLKDLASQVSSRSTQTEITPVIEELINNSELKEKVSSLNPSRLLVEKKYVKYLVNISFRNVSAEEFLTFIKNVENYSNTFLKIDYFSSRPVLRKPGLYNCEIKVATFTKES